MKKRILIILLVLCGVGAGALFAFRDWFAEALVRRAVNRAVAAADARGIDLQIQFREAAFNGFQAIVCNDLSGSVRVSRGPLGGVGQVVDFQIEQVVVGLNGVFGGLTEVSVTDGNAMVCDANHLPTGERLTGLRCQAEIDFSWRDPSGAVRRLEEEARRLMSEGRCSFRARIQGVVHFRAGRGWHEVRIESRRESGQTVLALNVDDIRRLSQDYTRKLTRTEIELVARHPARAPRLLRLSEQAAALAQALQRRDRSFPRDAFRHVYWSWLLTREFGAAFAEEVTDAHEIDPTYETGEGNRQMDLNNNAVGREWAAAGVTESELTARVRTDPRVLRSAPPDDAAEPLGSGLPRR